MPVIRNKSVLGDLDIPLIRRIVAFGEEVEVSAEHARELLRQHVNFDAVDAAAKKIAKEIADALKSVQEAAVTPDMLPVEPAEPPAPVDVVPVVPAAPVEPAEPAAVTEKASE